MSLIVLQLSHHVLQLLSSLLQVLLVDLELFGNLGTALLGQNVLQLNVELLFLLNENVFLTDLLGLGYQALLQRLNLLNEFVGLRICAFKLSPAMNVQRLLEFIC